MPAILKTATFSPISERPIPVTSLRIQYVFQSARTRMSALIALLCAVAGCGSGAGGDKAVVHGTVKLDGVALADAQIRFLPKGDNPDLGTAQAKTDANGAFTIQADANNNNLLRPGEFIVLISKIVQTDPAGGMGTPTVNLVPPQYNIQAETPLSVELRSGENKLPAFELAGEKK